LESQSGESEGTVPTIVFASQCEEIQANWDEKLIRQIVNNLASNAVKYSPQGGLVRFDLVCQEDQAIFRIQDEGIGIPAEDRERVFETFYRASNVSTIQGTGLGLAIAKKCVDLLKGLLTLESEVGVGTVVTVILPLKV
jgi:signal transduction histidine kinase